MKGYVVPPEHRALCVRVEPRTSAPIIRLTSHPVPLRMSNGQEYLSTSGYDLTAYTASTATAPGLLDFEGVAEVAGIGRDQLASGLYDLARCFAFAVDYRAPVEDAEPILSSILGKVTLTDDRYRAEEMALADALSQAVGKTYAPTCYKRFGGQEPAGCKVALGPITVSGTLTSVTSPLVFADSSRAELDDYFGAGLLTFTSGANAGLPGKEIKAYSGGQFTLHEAFHYTVAAGDQYQVVPGCRKRIEDCRDKWSNVANFGGFPHVPTNSVYGQAGRR